MLEISSQLRFGFHLLVIFCFIAVVNQLLMAE